MQSAIKLDSLNYLVLSFIMAGISAYFNFLSAKYYSLITTKLSEKGRNSEVKLRNPLFMASDLRNYKKICGADPAYRLFLKYLTLNLVFALAMMYFGFYSFHIEPR